jgi:hypothetical protein
VLASLREETPPQLRRRKAAVTHPEIYLHYGEQPRIGLHLPLRYSDQLRALAEAFFDPRGLWRGGDAQGDPPRSRRLLVLPQPQLGSGRPGEA